MIKFMDAIEDCGLADMGFKGVRYTWSQGYFSSTLVHGRLDRALKNFE